MGYLGLNFDVSAYTHKRHFLTWLLVGLYATIYVGWDMVHAHVHQETVSHSAQIEKDSCHRSIFHGEQDAHSSHITSLKTCASCHVISQPPVFTDVLSLSFDFLVFSDGSTEFSFSVEQQVSFLTSPRAPPAVV